MGQRLVVFLLAAALVSALAAAPAAASCGDARRAKPTPAADKQFPGRPPLIIGDSTMLLAVKGLARAGFLANARGCRQWAEGHRIVKSYRRAGRLPHLVLMHLGSNWRVTGRDIERTLDTMNRERVLGLVTPRRSSASVRAMRAAARRHPKRVILIDWAKHSRGKNSWFSGDGLHLSYRGVDAFIRLTRRALRYASGERMPNRVVID